MTTDESDSIEIALAWLRQSDAGDYGASWAGAAALFRTQITSADWVARLDAGRASLGAVVSRVIQQAKPQSIASNGPEGDYVVMNFKTEFSSGVTLGERVTTMKDPDGVYRVAGYYLLNLD